MDRVKERAWMVAQPKEARTVSTETASTKQPVVRRVVTTTRAAQDEHKQQNPALDSTIKRIVCGQGMDPALLEERRLPLEKQTTYLTDGIQASRELNNAERTSIHETFKEIVRGFQDEKNVQWNKIAVPWSEV